MQHNRTQLDPDSLHARISQAAYNFFLDRGAVDDPEAAVEDWLRAEALIKAELDSEAGARDLDASTHSGANDS